MTLPVRAEILLNISNWEKNLKKTSAQMEGFGKSMKTVANGVKAVWAGVAVGVIGSLYDSIVDVTKAAADDTKSQALLNAQMKKTWGGNEQLNKSIDAQIDKMSNATGVVDDKLRPALMRIAGVTKSPVKGMKMLKLSLDIAAKSGKDLNVVSQAMAKFLGGNKTALDRMIPGLKNADDKMKFLRDNYAGFAEIAGKNDPFGRINVVVENFKEKLGLAFLPIANNVADWLAGPDAQKAMDGIAKWVQDTFSWFTSPEAAAMFNEWYNNALVLFDIVTGMVEGLQAFLDAMPGAKSPGQRLYEQGKKGFDAKFAEDTKKYGAPQVQLPEGMSKFGHTKLFSPGQINKVENKGGNVTNITITGLISANEVVSELGKLARKRGIPMSKLLA
jgi:hypothetical protein